MAGDTNAGFDLKPSADGASLVLSGVLSFDTAAAVLRRGESMFGTSARSVDLSGVTHSDSAGLSVLLTWVERARRDGRVLRYTAIPDQLLKMARLCAVDGLLSAASGSAAPAAAAR